MDTLKCPTCGDEYTHLKSVETFTPKQRCATASEDRLSARLEFHCETCNTDFKLEITNYKGATILTRIAR